MPLISTRRTSIITAVNIASSRKQISGESAQCSVCSRASRTHRELHATCIVLGLALAVSSVQHACVRATTHACRKRDAHHQDRQQRNILVVCAGLFVRAARRHHHHGRTGCKCIPSHCTAILRAGCAREGCGRQAAVRGHGCRPDPQPQRPFKAWVRPPRIATPVACGVRSRAPRGVLAARERARRALGAPSGPSSGPRRGPRGVGGRVGFNTPYYSSSESATRRSRMLCNNCSRRLVVLSFTLRRQRNECTEAALDH